MLDDLGETYTQLVAFYVTARLFISVYYLALAASVPIVRSIMILQSLLILLPSLIWISSIYVHMPQRLSIIWVVIFLDIFTPWFMLIIIHRAKLFSKRLEELVNRLFEFYPAVNIEHKVERTNAFVTLVFGYAVVAIIYQSSAKFGLNAFSGKAVLGLIQSFCFNWIYFEVDGAELLAHAIRRDVVGGMFSYLS
jgi:low temperature requirement protein LtrA